MSDRDCIRLSLSNQLGHKFCSVFASVLIRFVLMPLMEMKFSDKKVKCKYCNYNCRPDNVRQHQKCKHENIKSVCECGVSVSTSSALNRHKQFSCILLKKKHDANVAETQGLYFTQLIVWHECTNIFLFIKKLDSFWHNWNFSSWFEWRCGFFFL